MSKRSESRILGCAIGLCTTEKLYNETFQTPGDIVIFLNEVKSEMMSFIQRIINFDWFDLFHEMVKVCNDQNQICKEIYFILHGLLDGAQDVANINIFKELAMRDINLSEKGIKVKQRINNI